LRDNPKTGIADKIKAMVMANFLPEEIADQMGAEPDNIDMFENLYFDARRYLDRRLWLHGICFPRATESRWLQAVFNRRRDGVQEVLLGQSSQNPNGNRWPRPFHRMARTVLHRAEDYCVALEASGKATSEKDLQLLLALSRLDGFCQLPLFEDAVKIEASHQSESPEKRMEKLQSVNWNELILNAESIVKTLKSEFDEIAHKQLVAAAESEAKKSGASSPDSVEENSISWQKVLQAVEKARKAPNNKIAKFELKQTVAGESEATENPAESGQN
jgi:hypothetical protein